MDGLSIQIVFLLFVIYAIHVKKNILRICSLISFACFLLACSNVQSSENSQASSTTPQSSSSIPFSSLISSESSSSNELTSSSIVDSSGIVHSSISSSVPPEELRLVSKEDYLVDFTKGSNSQFRFADNYSNGQQFNCTWSKNAGKFEDGKLTLSLYKQGNTYYGAEYRSIASTFHYGYYATRMKAADCPGVISSFFTYTNRPVWDEIDIEFLGKNMSQVQFNYYTNGQGGHEYLYDLGFDSSKEFHEYGFDWKQDSISFYVDGRLIHTATENIPTHSQQLMMNLWNCKGYDGWSGTFDESRLPVSASYEFIAYIPAE